MDRLLAVRDQILGYMKETLLEEHAFFKSADCEIERTIVADYHISFVIRVASGRYLFRVNVEQQSGLPNQIEYE